MNTILQYLPIFFFTVASESVTKKWNLPAVRTSTVAGAAYTSENSADVFQKNRWLITVIAAASKQKDPSAQRSDTRFCWPLKGMVTLMGWVHRDMSVLTNASFLSIFSSLLGNFFHRLAELWDRWPLLIKLCSSSSVLATMMKENAITFTTCETKLNRIGFMNWIGNGIGCLWLAGTRRWIFQHKF